MAPVTRGRCVVALRRSLQRRERLIRPVGDQVLDVGARESLESAKLPSRRDAHGNGAFGLSHNGPFVDL